MWNKTVFQSINICHDHSVQLLSSSWLCFEERYETSNHFGPKIRLPGWGISHFTALQDTTETFMLLSRRFYAIEIGIREPDALTVNASVITPSPVKCMSLQLQVWRGRMYMDNEPLRLLKEVVVTHVKVSGFFLENWDNWPLDINSNEKPSEYTVGVLA